MGLENSTRQATKRIARRATTAGLLTATLLNPSIHDSQRNYHPLDGCIDTRIINMTPVLTYGTSERGCSFEGLSRGFKFRECRPYKGSLYPQRIDVPDELRDHVVNPNMIMFEQDPTVGTCYITCFASAVSNISLNNDGPAVDPFMLSDALAEYNDSYSTDLESASDLNIKHTDINHLSDTVLLDGLPAIRVESHIVPESERGLSNTHLKEYIAEHLQKPDTYLILNVESGPDRFHAVVIVGMWKNPSTCETELIISEPNGGDFQMGSTGFAYVSCAWDDVGQTGGFVMTANLERTLSLTERVVRVAKAE